MRKKKTDRQKLVAALDKTFGSYIKARDKYVCFTCGKNKQMMELGRTVPQPGHLFSRVNYATRWDELNTHCQCSGCNMSHEFRPETYTLAFIKKYGVEAYERLFVKHKAVAKFSNSDLETMIKYYEQKLEALNENKS